MTTIAYSARHGCMAADQLVTCNGRREGTLTKIARRGSIFMAACGASTLASRFMDWARNGCIGNPPEMFVQTGPDMYTANGVLIEDRRILSFTPSGMEVSYDHYWTNGSGMEFAMGALEAGCSPKEAVEITNKRMTTSGAGVSVLTLPDAPRPVGVREKVNVYEAVLHSLQLRAQVVMDREKTRDLIDKICSWSYSHRMGNGELGEFGEERNVVASFDRLKKEVGIY